MKEYYKDFYGNTASITEYDDKSAQLIVKGKYGTIIKYRYYTTKKGAKNAMNRLSDGWEKK